VPPSLSSAAVLQASYPAGYTPSGGSAPSPAVAQMKLTAFPAAGQLTAVSGTVSGLANPSSYQAVLLLAEPEGGYCCSHIRRVTRHTYRSLCRGVLEQAVPGSRLPTCSRRLFLHHQLGLCTTGGLGLPADAAALCYA
jgi:hypothetical protein